MILMPILSSFIVRTPLTMAARPKMMSDAVVELLGEFKLSIELLPDEAFEHSLIADQYRTALSNKVEAVIHQIEAGALNGAIEKLSNDVIDKIEKWILEPWKTVLVEKIYEVIDVLELYI
jgi:hypothetical protein